MRQLSMMPLKKPQPIAVVVPVPVPPKPKPVVVAAPPKPKLVAPLDPANPYSHGWERIVWERDAGGKLVGGHWVKITDEEAAHR